MAAKWIEHLTGSLDQKRQYKADVARMEALPEPWRSAAQASYRYLLRHGAVENGDTLVTMFTDFVDLWESAATERTPVRDIVGEDPAEFVEAFAQAYSGKRWIDKERARLASDIDAAEREHGPGGV